MQWKLGQRHGQPTQNQVNVQGVQSEGLLELVRTDILFSTEMTFEFGLFPSCRFLVSKTALQGWWLVTAGRSFVPLSASWRRCSSVMFSEDLAGSVSLVLLRFYSGLFLKENPSVHSLNIQEGRAEAAILKPVLLFRCNTDHQKQQQQPDQRQAFRVAGTAARRLSGPIPVKYQGSIALCGEAKLEQRVGPIGDQPVGWRQRASSGSGGGSLSRLYLTQSTPRTPRSSKTEGKE